MEKHLSTKRSLPALDLAGDGNLTRLPPGSSPYLAFQPFAIFFCVAGFNSFSGAGGGCALGMASAIPFEKV